MVVVNDREKCCYCAGCPIVCPVGALSLEDTYIKVDEKKCINCGNCVKVCPVGAMKLEK